jgi:hypothetical protein
MLIHFIILPGNNTILIRYETHIQYFTQLQYSAWLTQSGYNNLLYNLREKQNNHYWRLVPEIYGIPVSGRVPPQYITEWLFYCITNNHMR